MMIKQLWTPSCFSSTLGAPLRNQLLVMMLEKWLWNLQPVLQLDVSRFKLRLPWFPSSWVLIWKSSVHVLPRTGTFGCHHFSQPKLNMKKTSCPMFWNILINMELNIGLAGVYGTASGNSCTTFAERFSMRWMKLCLPNRTTPSCKMLMSHRSPSFMHSDFLALEGKESKSPLVDHASGDESDAWCW